MKKKAALHNLGCKVNSYETEAMQQLLEENGYEIVSFEEQADVYIINTCTVTNIADRKSRQMLHRARKMNPQAVVVAAGCYVQARGAEVLEDGAVDMIIGNNQKSQLIPMLDGWFAAHQAKEEGQETDEVQEFVPSALLDLTRVTDYEQMNIRKTAEHTRAFLKVQDGCNQFCSYCIIPYARGRIRSRGLEDVQAEVRGLAEAGYKEIVLTGIHLSSYGLDFGTEEKTAEAPFGQGLQKLILALAEIDGIERIRLGSLEPRIITREFVQAIAACGKICPHFHLSLQSGCDSVLKRMNRHYTTQDFLNTCELLREGFEQPAITTDVIVGFPGETQEEFDTTMAFVEKVHFYEMHVFPYSRRQGTVADKMPGQVPEAVKKERSHQMIQLAERMSQEYRDSFVGRQVSVLLEEEGEEGYMVGYTKEYIRVQMAGGPELAGTQVDGKIACRNGKYILL